MHHGVDPIDVLVLVVAIHMENLSGLVERDVVRGVVLEVEGEVPTHVDRGVEVAEGEPLVLLVVRVHEE